MKELQTLNGRSNSSLPLHHTHSAAIKRLADFKTLPFALFMMYLFLMCLLLPSNVAYGQDIYCAGNCTSGDIRITKVELVDTKGNPLPTVCDQGVPVQVKLKLTFNVTSQTRYGFLVTADVIINGEKVGRVADCSGSTYQQGTRTYIISDPVNWTCGSVLELRNVFTAWENSAPSTKNPSICTRLSANDEITDCASIRPKCYYYGSESKDAIKVITPVQGGITYTSGCAGNTGYESITLTASGEGGTAPYSYQWEVREKDQIGLLASTTSSSTNTVFKYTPTSKNKLEFKLTITDSSSPKKSQSYTQDVDAKTCCTTPVITLQPEPQVKCAGETAVFSVASEGGSPEPAVQWQVLLPSIGADWSDLPGANNATLTLSAVTTAMSGNKYRAVLRSDVCDPAVSEAATLAVNAIPAAPTNAGNQTVCQTTQAQTLTASVTVPQGTSVVWYTASSGGTVVQNPVLTSVGTVTYYAEAVKDGCNSVTRTPVTLTINAAPAAPTSGGNQTFCALSPVQKLTATATAPAGSSIVWYTSASGATVVNDPSLSAVGTVTYYAASKNNLTDCLSLTRTAVTLTMNATPPVPVATVTVQPTCAVTSGTIAVSGANSNYTYTLSGPTAKSPNNTGVFTGLQPGTYAVTATLGQCTSATSTALTVNSVPDAPATPVVVITAYPDCSSSTGTLKVLKVAKTETINEEEYGEDYEFSNDGGKNWTPTPTFSFVAGEGYSISVRRVNDVSCVASVSCDAEKKVTVISSEPAVESLQGVEKSDQLSTYPVPFSDMATLEFTAEREGSFVINLYDMKGTLVKQLKTGTVKAGETTLLEVDGKTLPEGMYLARMVNGAGVKTVKLLKKNK
ncbi:Ig-like domain-containing protein [Botryobacter ruber]|uniref:Ig-like domain-containing protein n=1 Tax=Botryobacter ruber TaxID=2171629 RepID=UPI001F0C2F69|nr:T9SS type A sorting domain-containing protein [Botryobacter ruber]